MASLLDIAVNSVSEISVDYAVIASLTNNSKIIDVSNNGYFLSSLLRKSGKEMNKQCGYIGSIIGGAIKYTWVSNSLDKPLEGNAKYLNAGKGSINQIIYQAFPDAIALLPVPGILKWGLNTVAVPMIAESSDAFISGAMIQPELESKSYSFLEGLKHVIEGGNVGVDTAISSLIYTCGISLSKNVAGMIYDVSYTTYMSAGLNHVHKVAMYHRVISQESLPHKNTFLYLSQIIGSLPVAIIGREVSKGVNEFYAENISPVLLNFFGFSSDSKEDMKSIGNNYDSREHYDSDL